MTVFLVEDMMVPAATKHTNIFIKEVGWYERSNIKYFLFKSNKVKHHCKVMTHKKRVIRRSMDSTVQVCE